MAILALLSCAFATGTPSAHVHYSAHMIHRDGVIPIVFGVNPTNATPGQLVQFTVGLSGEATGDEVYNVSATSGAFSSIPVEIQPEAGATQIQFNATISSTYNGGINASVSGNGAKVSCMMAVATTNLHLLIK